MIAGTILLLLGILVLLVSYRRYRHELWRQLLESQDREETEYHRQHAMPRSYRER